VSKKPFVIYKSSAGSGKTFTLAKNYIRLALKSKNHFKKILAVTFTNKAAEEMKLRVLEMIDKISSGDDKELIIEFSKYYKISPQEIIKSAKNLKSNILHNYSYFSITTIDTFFYSIIQSFTRDLKFRGKFNIEMDLDLVINEVVENFLSDLKKGSTQSKWLTEFSKEKIVLGKDFMIDSELKRMTRNLFSEDFKALSDKMPNGGHTEKIKELRKKVYSVKKDFEKEVITESSTLADIINKNGFSTEDFSYKDRGVAGFIRKTSEGLIGYPGVRVLSCVESPESWVTNKHEERDKVISFVNDKLFSKLIKLVEIFENKYPMYNSALEIRNNVYTYGILSELQKYVRDYRDEKEVILISDISELLYEVIKDEDIPFVFEKVGNSFRNFLIDEFQDTSFFQWKNFKSLIKDSLSSGDENIIVGDIKQSIYRWRGSDSEIMNQDINIDIDDNLSQLNHLRTNWRSGEKIIESNNHIFSLITNSFENEQIRNHLKRIYNKDITQKVREDMMGKGYVEVTYREKGEEKIDSAKKYTIDCIKKIQDRGYSAGDIGIIVRDNNDAKIIAETLIQQSLNSEGYNFNHVSADALDIKSAPVVCFFISIFKYFSNFKDRLSLSEIVHFYYRFVLKSDDISHYSLSNEEKLSRLPKEFKDNIFKVSRLPVYELVEELVRIFDLNKIESQIPYLQAFLDLVLEFKLSQGKEITSFVDWWEKNGNKKLNLTEQDNAIQLITIHKSKGLEFSHVIIPFFDWTLDNDTRAAKEKIMWVNLKKFDNQFDFPYPISYKSSHPKSVFSDVYIKERLKAYEDNINLMYVSFTRPKFGLFIRAEVTRKEIKNVSDLLYSIIKGKLNSGLYISGEISKKNKIPEKKLYHLKKYPSFSWKDRIKVRTTSDKGIDFENISRGKKMHEIFSFIRNYNEIDRGIEIGVLKNIIKSRDKKYYKEVIEKIINNNKVKRFFNPNNKSYNEVELLNESGDVFRLDRVVTMEDDSVHVIDYKTGEENKKYNKQINNYKKLLSCIYAKEISGHIIYIDLNKVIKV